MRKNIKQLTFIGILLLGFSLVFTSCEKDDSVLKSNTDSKTKEDLKYNVSNISLLESKKNLKLAGKLQKYISAAKVINGKTIVNDSLQIAVNDSQVKYLETQDGSYHSYTFSVTDYDHPEGIKNLMISLQPDGTYKEEIISYNFSEDDIELIRQNIEIDIQDKISFLPLEDGTFGGDLLNKVYYSSDGYCFNLSTIAAKCCYNVHSYASLQREGVTCRCESEGNYVPSAGEVELVIDITSCPSGGGTNNGGNTPPSNTNNPNPYNPGNTHGQAPSSGTTVFNNGCKFCEPLDTDPLSDCPEPDEVLYNQLVNYFGSSNFESDCSLASNEMIGFDSFGEVEGFFENIVDNQFTVTSSELEHELSTIRRDVFTMEFTSFPKADIVAAIKVNVPDANNGLECLDVLSANTYLGGNYSWFDWTQLDDDDPNATDGPLVLVNEAQDSVKISILGVIEIGLNINGNPFRVRRFITVLITYNYSTGELNPNYSYWYPTN